MKHLLNKIRKHSGPFGLAILLVVALAYSMAMAEKGGKDDHGHEHEHHDEHGHAEKKNQEDKNARAEESHDEHEHAEGEEGEEASGAIGPGKAVEAVDAKGKRFKLSPKARTVIGVKVGRARGAGDRVIVPRASVVEFGSEYGIYVERDGWFHLEEVRIISRSKDEWQVSGGELRPNSSIATEGVGLLRVAELDAFGGGSHGHSH